MDIKFNNLNKTIVKCKKCPRLVKFIKKVSTEKRKQNINEIYWGKPVPGFGNSANSYNSFIIIALLDDWKNRKKGQQVVLREAIGKIVTLPQALAFPISPQSIRVSNYNKPVQMVIYGNTYEELEAIQKKLYEHSDLNKNTLKN